MNIKFEFFTMYEPGENTPPIFNMEGRADFDCDSCPNYKDRVKFVGETYFVYDVVHSFTTMKTQKIYIKAVRKVTHPPEFRR